MPIKLLHIPMPDPFSCHIFEVKEFPECDDFALLDREELEDFLTEVFNPNGNSILLGIELEEEDIEYIESVCLPGVRRLKKVEP
jgi:hypothetical protein